MKLAQTLSIAGVNASIEASEIGKDKLGDNFHSSSVTRLLKNGGFWADITDKRLTVYKLRVKKDGKLTVINFK